jgi:hypothetical protein
MPASSSDPQPPVPVAIPVVLAERIVPPVPPPFIIRPAKKEHAGFQISRRDLILLSAGGGGVALAVVAGVVLYRMWSRRRED